MTAIRTIAASIVTYNPSGDGLKGLVDVLRRDVARIYIFDNNSVSFPDIRADAQVHVIRSPHNLGISAGHNRCLTQAFACGADAVILFDQDSTPSQRMVNRLLRALNTLRGHANKVAAVGPVCRDPRSGTVFPIPERAEEERDKLEHGQSVHAITKPVDFLITSGSLIPREAWENVGDMKEAFFIDAIDMEWGLRAKSMGWISYAVASAHMDHRVGDYVIKLPFMNKQLCLHSANRYYYIVRNSLLLVGLPYVPRRFKTAAVAKAVMLCMIAAIYRRDLQAVRWGLRGLRHALTARAKGFPRS